MGRASEDCRAVLPARQDRLPAIRGRDDAADSLSAAVALPVRLIDGRGAARHVAIPRVRPDRPGGYATARRDDESTILRFRHLLEQHNLAPALPRVVNDFLGVKPITDVGDSSGSTADNGFRARCSSVERRTKLLASSLSSIHIDAHKPPLTKARSITSDRSHRSITKALFCPSFVFPISDPLPKIAA